MTEHIGVELPSSQEWVETIKNKGQYYLHGMLPEGTYEVGGKTLEAQHEGGYVFYPINYEGDQEGRLKWAHFNALLKKEAYPSRIEIPRDRNRLLFSTDFYDQFNNKWSKDGTMMIEYQTYVSRESYPGYESRPGLQLSLGFILPEKVGQQFVQQVMGEPELIEQVYASLTDGLGERVKRVKTAKLELIEGGKIGLFSGGRILGKERMKEVAFPHEVGEAD